MDKYSRQNLVEYTTTHGHLRTPDEWRRFGEWEERRRPAEIPAHFDCTRTPAMRPEGEKP